MEGLKEVTKMQCDQPKQLLLNGCDFVICQLCNWTATAFRTRNGQVLLERCQSCLDGNCLSFIPIAGDESYRFTMDPKRGLDIEFQSRN